MQGGDDPDKCFTTDKSVANELLRKHSVQFSTNLNLTSLMPYLIEHGCLTYGDMSQFQKPEVKKCGINLNFIRLVQEGGVSAFNAFMNALVHFVEDKRDMAHKELLVSLQSGLRRLNYGRRMSDTSVGSRTSVRSDHLFTSIPTSQPCGPIPEENSTNDIEAEDPEKDIPQPPPPPVPESREEVSFMYHARHSLPPCKEETVHSYFTILNTINHYPWGITCVSWLFTINKYNQTEEEGSGSSTTPTKV